MISQTHADRKPRVRAVGLAGRGLALVMLAGYSPNLAAETWEMTLEEGLNLGADIMLQGVTDFDHLDFSTPQRWDLTADPILNLKFDHSAVLIPERSTLTVLVNDSPLATVRLDAATASGGQLSVPIPRSVLQDYNRLQYHVVQHVGPECEDPFDPALWSRVLAKTSITWTYDVRPFATELLDFPYPYFDPTGYGPLEFTLVDPGGLSAGELDALSWLGPAFGRIATYRELEMAAPASTLDGATTHALVVGTPASNPLVAALLVGALPAAGEGLVRTMVHPFDPRFGILLVAGGDDAGLRKAAIAVASDDRYELLSGVQSSIREVRDPIHRPTVDPSPLAPAGETFPLTRIGIDDHTVRGFYSAPIEVPLTFEGDTKVRVDAASFTLRYAYGAGLDTRLSSMEVRLNGVALRSQALDDPDGEALTELKVRLPHDLLRPSNKLLVQFHLFPADFDPCRFTTDRAIWGTVFANSEFSVVRDHFTMLPELALLRHDLWPLNIAAAGQGVTFVLPEETDTASGTAAMLLAAQLGVVTPGNQVDIRMVPASATVLSANPERDAVLFVESNPNPIWTALTRDGTITASGDSERLLQRTGLELLRASVGTRYATIEEAAHPNAPSRSILVVRGSDGAALIDAAAAMARPDVLFQLSGNLAVLTPSGGVNTLAVAEQRQVGTVSVLSRGYSFLKQQWLLVTFGALLGALVLTRLVRGWARNNGGQAE